MRTAVTNICSHFRMQLLNWSQGHVATTTSPQFLRHSNGSQCTRERCSRLRDCRCRGVLTVPLPAMCLNSAFLLPLLHTANVSGQARRAYCKFLGLEPQLASGASLLRDRHCGTVFLLLYTDWRRHYTPSSDKWQAICSTSDELTYRSDIHHHLALLCCDISVIPAPQTELLAHLLTNSQSLL